MSFSICRRYGARSFASEYVCFLLRTSRYAYMAEAIRDGLRLEAIAEDIVEEKQAAVVEQQCQPSKRIGRRGLEVGVERRERDSTDPSSQSVIEIADNEFQAATPRRFARERPAARVSNGSGSPRNASHANSGRLPIYGCWRCRRRSSLRSTRVDAPWAAPNSMTFPGTRTALRTARRNTCSQDTGRSMMGRCARERVLTTRRGGNGPSPRPSNVAFVGTSGSGHRAHGDSYSLRTR
jgi:hypothetical protein